MKFEQRLFLAMYYPANLAFSKVGGALVEHRLSRPGSALVSAWDEVRRRASQVGAWLVVGNGPSLRPEDLTALAHLPSVASNRINLLFDRTDWRPTLYTIADPLLAFKLPARHFDDFERVLTAASVYHLVRTDRKLPYKHESMEAVHRKIAQRDFEISPTMGLWSARTVTIPNIQLAIWAGARRIYLIGCDHYYQEPKVSGTTAKLAHQSSNHFHPDYRKPGEIVNAAPIEMMNRGFSLMREFVDAAGIEVFNISRTSHLEAFERMSVEEALEQSPKPTERARS